MKKSKSYPDLHERIGKIPIPAPSEGMDDRFKQMVEEEKKKILLGESVFEKRSWIRIVPPAFFRIAAGIALFLMGWFGASWTGVRSIDRGQLASLSDEVVKLRQTVVLAMIQQTSPVERIKAVKLMSTMEVADDKIIESLLSTLVADNNDNVRLVALDALILYTDRPEVREGMIHAISKQSSPMVQLRMAEIMVALQEKRSVPEFQKILHSVNLNYSVRNKLDETIRILI